MLVASIGLGGSKGLKLENVLFLTLGGVKDKLDKISHNVNFSNSNKRTIWDHYIIRDPN